MQEKRLGILGGMGPKATSIFFDNIVNKTVAESDNEHIDIVILNNTKIPDRTQAIESGDYKALLDELLASIKQLELLGVDNIAIPCNTTCYFIDELRKHTSVNIINIVEETVKYISNISPKKNIRVGILATDGTVKAGTYRTALTKHNMECVQPNIGLQDKVMDIIYNQVKKTGAGNIDDFNCIIDSMKNDDDCDYIILGCTELSYFAKSHLLPDCCVNSLEVLTKVSIEKTGKKYKEPFQF